MTGTRMVAIYFKLLLGAGLTFTLATAVIDTSVSSENCAPYYVLPVDIIPVHYTIILEPYADTFRGESKVLFNLRPYILTQTQYITLHAYKLQIEEESIELATRKDNTIIKPQAYSYCTETQTLILEFNKRIPSGHYFLSMRFNGSLHGSAGFIAINYTDHEARTRQMYMTLFEPTGARRVFPCWDQSSLRASFDISVVHPKYQTALSNMPVQRTSKFINDKTQTYFQTTPNLPAYLVAIAVFNIYSVNNNIYSANKDDIHQLRQHNTDIVTMWCRGHVKKQLNFAQQIANKVSHFMNKYLSFYMKKIYLVVFPELPVKYVKGWKFVIMREEDIVYTTKYGRELEIQMKIAHEVTRQYTENFLNLQDWSHLWFNKALTLYLSYRVLDEILETRDLMELFVVQILQPALHNDELYYLNITVYNTLSKLDRFYAIFIYKKASAIIHMLEHLVTKELFREALANHLTTFQAVSAQQFWTFLNATENQFEKKHGYKLKEVIDPWLSQSNKPTLYVEVDQYDDNTTVRLKQGIYDAKNKVIRNTKWKIPITFTTNTEFHFANTTPACWMNSSTMTLSMIKLDKWIIFNLQQSGYYRVRYNIDHWLQIAHYLRDADHQKIHPLNRAQIIDDAYHFMMIDQLHYTNFTYLIHYLKIEHHFLPWHSMMKILHYMSPFFDLPESQAFKDYMLDILNQYINNIPTLNNTSTPDFMILTTMLLTQNWSCKHGLRRCRIMANEYLMLHLANPKEYLTRLGQEVWMYCAGVMDAADTMNQLATKFIFQNNTKIIEYLACVENDTMVRDLLTSVAIDVKDIWTQLDDAQLTKLYHLIVKKHARKENILIFILQNFNRIMAGRLNKVDKLADLIMSVYSKCDLEKISAFLKTDVDIDDITFLKVNHIIRMRETQLDQVKDMFVNRFPPTQVKQC